MKAESISVDLRLSAKPDSKVKAFADVTIPLGDGGTVTVLGFSVLEGDGRPARVMSPARKGQNDRSATLDYGEVISSAHQTA